MKPKFSVVLVNYANSWDLIERCISSLETSAELSRSSMEIIVVDNDEVATNPVLGANVRLVRVGRNVGFARGVNRGIAESSGDLIILVNPDTTVHDGFFGEVGEFFDSHPDAGVAGPRILDDDRKLQLSARREISLVSGLLGRTSSLTRLLPESSFVRDQFPAASATSPTRVDWVSGACMVISRDILENVGPLDERFFMYFEDADICRRTRDAGYSVYYLPNVEVVHDAGGSTRSRPKAIRHLHESAFLYHRKHANHGPLNILSGVVLAGLVARGGTRLLKTWLQNKGSPSGR